MMLNVQSLKTFLMRTMRGYKYTTETSDEIKCEDVPPTKSQEMEIKTKSKGKIKMGKKIPSKVVDDTIKLKLNSVSSYDISRYLNVSDTWVDKIWQLYRFIRDDNESRVAESIQKRYAGADTVKYLYEKAKKKIPESVQNEIDRKTKKAESEEQQTIFNQVPKPNDEEWGNTSILIRLNMIIKRLDELIELWEK